MKRKSGEDETYRIIEDARNVLGKMYYLGGNGIIKQYDLALQVFKEMDEQDYDKFSLLYIGKMYFEGVAGEKNEQLGFKYLKKSAEQEVARAQLMVAEAYIYGKGTAVDSQKAFYWIEKAVNNNSDEAKSLLGVMYYYGDDDLKIERNAQYGLKLINEAAEAGVEAAILELEKIKKSQTVYIEPDIRDYADDRSEENKKWFDN